MVAPGFVRTPLTDKNDFKMPFIVEADFAASEIMNGIERKAYEIHFPKRFSYLLKLLRLLPTGLYYRLLSKATPQ